MSVPQDLLLRMRLTEVPRPVQQPIRMCSGSHAHVSYKTESQMHAMATSSSCVLTLNDLEDCIREKIQKDRYTHKEISEYLRRKYPGVRGFSVRSFERFCSACDIHKTEKMSDHTLDTVVTAAVKKVRR